MKNYKELYDKVVNLRGQLRDAEDELNETPDGYEYKVVYCRYDNTTVKHPINAYQYEQIFFGSEGGDKYIINEHYTNNPKYETRFKEFCVDDTWYIASKDYDLETGCYVSSIAKTEHICGAIVEDSKTLDEIIEDFKNYHM